MGCASSTPMVQTAGSDMLKAATHVAEDATKTAEEAVQGVKGTVEKTLETAKEAVATKVEEVKHDVENTLKEKAHNIDDAKNVLLEKLHLNPSAGEKTQEAAESAAAALKEDAADAEKLTETLKHSTETMLSSSSGGTATEAARLARTDTETDSLRTSTPEPEIERALANTKSNKGEGDDDDDDDDNPPTPKPTYSELENLGNELLHQQQQQHTVNDTAGHPANDPLMMAAAAAVDNTTTPATTTTTTTDTINSSAMHITDIQIATASAPSIASAIAASTASAWQLNQGPLAAAGPAPSTQPPAEPAPIAPPTKSKAAKREEKLAADRAKQKKLIQKLLEEKRPSTTEWEKYADMLALFRKYNPHDAFRRGGTLTKFNGHGGHLGATHLREKALHGRGDDESSDTTSNWGHKSSAQRSSAHHGGRLPRQRNRPNSANQQSANGSSARRNSNTMNSGRKFDYNPSRSRVNDRGSSSVSSGHNLANLPSTASAYRLSPSLATHSPTHAHESVKSPSEMRSQHSSPLGTNTGQRLEPLRPQQPGHAGQQPKQHHFPNVPTPTQPQPHPLDAMPPTYLHHHSPLTRESSTTSLSSQNKYLGRIRSYKSSMELRAPLHTYHLPPVRNTSSFLTTPRTSPFSITKSYTDLYFSSSSNKENEASFQTDLSSIAQQRHVRDKSPYKIRDRCEVCSKKYVKT